VAPEVVWRRIDNHHGGDEDTGMTRKQSCLDRLGFAPASTTAAGRAPSPDTDTVRRIVAELERLEPARARYLAAFAYVLSRVAGADLHISSAETEKIIEIVKDRGHLPEEQAVLVAEIAKSQHRLLGGTENFLVTGEFRDIAIEEQRRDLLDCLFAVSAAEAGISSEEDAQIKQIVSELGFDHQQFVRARLATLSTAL
jgi:uncharacterized tellurite resistance protein B-like protein